MVIQPMRNFGWQFDGENAWFDRYTCNFVMYGMKWGYLVAWAGDIGRIGDE
jgi:hypothetical protein